MDPTNDQRPAATTAGRTVRFLDVPAADVARAADAIEDFYEDRLDVLVVRGAFDRTPLSEAGERLDRDDSGRAWARPNQKMPVEDIQLIGTDTPATPTYQTPKGPSLDAYLESAARHRGAVDGLFDTTFHPDREIPRVLAQFSSGRPLDVPRASDGRAYAPLTVRRLTDGKQIGLHHDYHYPLPLYSELAPRLDTRTLVSFVATLQSSDRGGELVVYAVTPDTPNAPKMANGWTWDLEAIERGFDHRRFTIGAGDLFLLASGRCLHRVTPIVGPRARVTMGGFLALDRARQTILYWS